jgi:HAE1 family hydrophobic/amphiphilic exporter-1
MTQMSQNMKTNQASKFFEFTTTRPVAILMVVIGVVVFGWISYKQLPVNLMPDISYPSLTVRTEYTGTAPEEIETTISRPVEQALGIVGNVVSISSISKAGQSDVKLEFTWDTDMNEATAEVREKLDQVFLPEDVERPLLLRYDPTLDPIMRLGLYGDASLIYLRYLGDEELKRILETVEGVAAIKIKGGLEEEIRVELQEHKLALIGINIQQVRNRLAQENVNLAGGNLKEGQTEYLVRTLNEFKSVDEIANVVIGNWNGKEIKIRDVAEVKRTFKDREIITRIDGKESVEIEVYKEADANVVSVAERVKNRVFGTAEQQAFVANLSAKTDPLHGKKAEEQKAEKKEEAKPTNGKSHGGPDGQQEEMKRREMTSFIAYNLPTGIKIDLLSDQSVFIKNAVNEVTSTAILGGVLAVVVLFVFLRNVTATIIVGISIPISIVATFAPMKMMGVSLNLMTLGGLALGIGMLVDNSIVVLESIARCREEGDNLIQATVRGVSEVGGAVTASTLTTVAVFFPIVFVEGVAGQIFGNLALTVVFSLVASLAVALFLIPMLQSREGSKFIQGVQTGNVMNKHVLQISTESKIDALVAEENRDSFLEKSQTGVKLLAQTVGQIVLNLLKTTSALLVAFIKQIFILILTLLLPILGLLRVVRILKFRPSEWATNFSGQQDFWRITFIKEIWPTFLVNQSLPALIEDARKIKTRFQSSGWLGRILRSIPWALQFVFYILKFVFQFILEIFFRLLHFLNVTLASFFKGLFNLIRLLFAAPTRLILTGFNRGYGWLESKYPKVMEYSLNNHKLVLGATLGVFLFTLLVIGPKLGSELIPEVHQGEFNLDVTLPVGTPVERTDERIAEIQNFVAAQEGVNKVAAVSGTDKTANTSSEEGEHTAKLTVNLKRASSVIVAEERLINKIRSEMANYSGFQWKISRPTLFSFKTPIEVEIHGYNLQKLQEITHKIEEEMRGVSGMFDVKSNIQRGNPEVQIYYNRPLLAKYGLNIFDVASIVRNKVRGDVATEFKEQDRKIDILVRLREEDRESINDLRRLVVNPGAAVPIPLEAVADIKVKEGPAEIRRIDQQRTAVISANISGRDLSSVTSDIFQILRLTEMPSDFTYNMGGQNKEMQTSLDSLKLALALAIFLVYIVMASQFESVVHPFIIIFTIPLALIGVILFLYIFQMPVSVMVFLGMIILAGIVVNNAIVLVDYINRLRERGMDKAAAIIEAGKVRLRPIMMTTATTVLGLLPLALGLGDGAEIRTPMAITVIVGLITSTLLTLVIIPTVYSLVDRRT